MMFYSNGNASFNFILRKATALKSTADTSLVVFGNTVNLIDNMKTKNFYIIASASSDPDLKVEISGPYNTQKSAEADLASAVKSAKALDPCAREFQYSICQLESDKPGIIQHMAETQLTSAQP